MFVLFDALPLQTPSSRERGIGRYSANLLGGLRQARPEWDIRLLTHSYLEPPDDPAVEGLAAHEFVPPVRLMPWTWEVNRRYFSDWVAALAPDWVFHPSVFESSGITPEYGLERPRVAVLVHDLIPISFTHTYNCHSAGWSWYGDRYRTLAEADLVLTNSQATADEVTGLAGADCPPVVNARGASGPDCAPVTSGVRLAAEASIRKRFGFAKPFILYVGGWDHRKNMFGCIAGYARLPAAVRAQFDFVVACKLAPDQIAQLQAEAARVGVAGKVHFTGFVTDAELKGLYQACRLFFFPSHYEGLGMPVVEAMTYGCPVVVSRNSALPEYAGPLSWYCDPNSPDSMGKALAEALAEPKAQREAERVAFARGFSWLDSGERAARGLERHALTRSLRPVPKPRIAWVAPAPPSEAPAARQALALAEGLSDRFEIDWVVPPDSPAPPADVAKRWAVVRDHEVKRRHAAKPYDLFVTFAGSGPEFRYQGALARRHPGLVVAPDALAGGIADGFGLGIDFAALRGAFAFAAQSAAGWRALKSGAGDAPVFLVPPATASGSVPDLRTQLGTPAGRKLVGVFGAIDGAAGALAAMAATPLADTADFVLISARAATDPGGWARAAQAAGVEADIVSATLADIPGLAAACDVAVWLGGNCEAAPALLAQALSRGAACVVDATAPAGAELPPAAALKARSPGELARAAVRLASDSGLRDACRSAARELPGGVELLAAAITEAIRLTRAADLPWRSDALNAIFDCPEPVPPGLLDQWARLRARLLARQVAPAEVLEETLPEVGSRPGRKSAAA